MQPFIFQTRMTRMTQINYNFYTPFSYGYWLWLLAMAVGYGYWLGTLNLKLGTLNPFICVIRVICV